MCLFGFVRVLCSCSVFLLSSTIFFFKQKTAYEMRISDWSSDVCSSDLDFQRADRRRRDLDLDAILLGIGDRFFAAGEAEAQLALRVAAARPAHQRIGLARFGGCEFGHPASRPRASRLHRILGLLDNTRFHRGRPVYPGPVAPPYRLDA